MRGPYLAEGDRYFAPRPMVVKPWFVANEPAYAFQPVLPRMHQPSQRTARSSLFALFWGTSCSLAYLRMPSLPMTSR
jgi:hypothetical protein